MAVGAERGVVGMQAGAMLASGEVVGDGQQLVMGNSSHAHPPGHAKPSEHTRQESEAPDMKRERRCFR